MTGICWFLSWVILGEVIYRHRMRRWEMRLRAYEEMNKP